jgi:hypothetical protein
VRDGCASRSRACGEPLHGTASRARRWVLYEHPGAWGAEVLDDATLPSHLAAHLRGLATGLPARVLLLRRAPGVPRTAPERVLFAGESTPGGGWMERFTLRHPDELLEIDLGELSHGRSVGGEPIEEPLYLVCTNGKHDACCAEYGRPVIDALAPMLDGRVWECSHVGGDRFAGNLVCLPDGLYYGHLDPAVAASVVATHEAGRVDLDHWRGRSALPFPAQSAEAYVRRQLGLLGRGDLVATRVARAEDGRITVVFRRADGASVSAVVAVSRTATERTLTCGGVPSRPPVHELVSVDTTP